MQFSSDDDEFEEVSDQEPDETNNLLTQGERITFKAEGRGDVYRFGALNTIAILSDYGAMDENQGEEDPQIASAAEAMVQLSGFYGQPQMQDESMDADVDPNYDPSDFLGNLKQEPRESKPALDLSQYEASNTSAEVDNVPNQDVKPAAIHDDLAISDSDEEPENLMIVPKTEQSTFDEEPSANLMTLAPQPEQNSFEDEQPANQSAEQPNTSTEPRGNPDDDAGDDLLWF